MYLISHSNYYFNSKESLNQTFIRNLNRKKIKNYSTKKGTLSTISFIASKIHKYLRAEGEKP